MEKLKRNPALTKKRIVDGAIEMFLNWGYHNVSMELLSSHIEINRRTIYRHYMSKDHLTIAIAVQEYSKILDDLKKYNVVKFRTGFDELEYFFRFMFSLFIKNQENLYLVSLQLLSIDSALRKTEEYRVQ